MKRIILPVLLAGFMAMFTACSGDSKTEGNEETTENTDVQADPNAEKETKAETGDAQGDDEEITTTSATKTEESFINFKANGTQMGCAYKPNGNPNASIFQRKKDDSYSMIVFERGSTDQLREKIMLNIINYNPRTLEFPYEVKPEAGKHFQVNYQVKKSGIYITYYANAKNGGDKFNITLTGYDNGVLKGTFEGEVKNTANKIVQIEDGEFEVKLDEKVLDAENPA